MSNSTLGTLPTLEGLPGSEVLEIMWLLFSTFGVLFMQLGFAMLEAGSVRRQSLRHILLKNVMDTCMCCLTWTLLGFGLYAHEGNSIMGTSWLGGSHPSSQDGQWFKQFSYATTAATIVSGGVAERCSLTTYLVMSSMLCAWTYPVAAHWIWADDGWLSKESFVDHAGSCAVHMVGGITAMVGAIALGPRYRRFKRIPKLGAAAEAAVTAKSTGGRARSNKPSKTGESRSRLSKAPSSIRRGSASKAEMKIVDDLTYPGQSVELRTLGALALWFGWYFFNTGSGTVYQGGMMVATRVAMTTTLSGCAGGVSALLVDYMVTRTADVDRVLNGLLAGLVAVTAGCANVSLYSSVAIGLVGGLTYLGWSTLMRKFGVDDPLDASAVHFAAGAWGTFAVGLFHSEEGLFTTGQGTQLGVQTYGLLTVGAWVLFFAVLVVAALRFLAAKWPHKYQLRREFMFEVSGLNPELAQDQRDFRAHFMTMMRMQKDNPLRNLRKRAGKSESEEVLSAVSRHPSLLRMQPDAGHSMRDLLQDVASKRYRGDGVGTPRPTWAADATSSIGPGESDMARSYPAPLRMAHPFSDSSLVPSPNLFWSRGHTPRAGLDTSPTKAELTRVRANSVGVSSKATKIHLVVDADNGDVSPRPMSPREQQEQVAAQAAEVTVEEQQHEEQPEERGQEQGTRSRSHTTASGQQASPDDNLQVIVVEPAPETVAAATAGSAGQTPGVNFPPTQSTFEVTLLQSASQSRRNSGASVESTGLTYIDFSKPVGGTTGAVKTGSGVITITQPTAQDLQPSATRESARKSESQTLVYVTSQVVSPLAQQEQQPRTPRPRDDSDLFSVQQRKDRAVSTQSSRLRSSTATWETGSRPGSQLAALKTHGDLARTDTLVTKLHRHTVLELSTQEPGTSAPPSGEITLQIASDLHIEMWDRNRFYPKDYLFANALQPSADVLCLLGDIGVCGTDVGWEDYKMFLILQATRYKLVVILAGNHEFYSGPADSPMAMTVAEIKDRIHGLCDSVTNLVFLDRRSCVVDGVRLVGCTLWSEVDPMAKSVIQGSMNDYALICTRDRRNGKVRQVTCDDTTAWHRKDLEFLQAEVKAAKELGQPVCVLTHHTPSFSGTSAPEHEGSPLSSAFSTDLEYMLDRADDGPYSAIHSWCFGHTHHICDRTQNGVRLVSNQYGYTSGNDGSSAYFDPHFKLTVSKDGDDFFGF